MNRILEKCGRSAFRTVRHEWPVMLLGAWLGGCGGGGSSDPVTPPPPPPPAPITDPALPPLGAPVSLNDNHMVGSAHWSNGDTSEGAQGQAIGALECLTTMPETYHVHTHLSIFLNGEALAIPADIGIVSQSATADCFYSIHTHDQSGKIHIEAAAAGTFTLGQVFSIWGQPVDQLVRGRRPRTSYFVRRGSRNSLR